MPPPAQQQPGPAELDHHPIRPAYLAKPGSQLTVAERVEGGRTLRNAAPREAHAAWAPAADRADPVALVLAAEAGRVERLLPIRHGRMVASPFAFFRGAAAIMAADLAATPSTGYIVQACGDCHLLNFGAFATPERRVIFDINDFDETFPAPWEWDLKRLATSFVVASRTNGHRPADATAAAQAVARSYAQHMAELSTRKALDVWYSYLDWEELIESTGDAVLRRRRSAVLQRALHRDSATDFVKLGHFVDGQARIKDNPPLLYHPDTADDPGYADFIAANLQRYRATLAPERRVLLDRYELADVAIKVVGVGSVGTLCAVALLLAAGNDPLFLQVKQVSSSVLEPYVGLSPFSSDGERVVFGQRLMQAASDVFLGHIVGVRERHFYVRQLRDVKIRPMVEIYTPANMADYARSCGIALARAHARSGDPALLAGYIGKGRTLADAIAAFAVAYADQNERDHAALVDAVRDGRVEVQFEEA
jgi:uncharacterized protein (DUF2252 family)